MEVTILFVSGSYTESARFVAGVGATKISYVVSVLLDFSATDLSGGFGSRELLAER